MSARHVDGTICASWNSSNARMTIQWCCMPCTRLIGQTQLETTSFDTRPAIDVRLSDFNRTGTLKRASTGAQNESVVKVGRRFGVLHSPEEQW